MRSWFLLINIYGHTPISTHILRRRLTVETIETEIKIETIERQVIGIQIYFVIKAVFLLFSSKLVCSLLIDLIDLVINSRLIRSL